ncbi:MAG: AAA family ATPase [Verrucomicrobiales bacterium]|nr:AAA family ATPase [Verrucomicrobiales bacterium]
MIERLQIDGYRSLCDVTIPFDRVTLITGANGVGKSNVYRAMRLLQSLAMGTFGETLAEEGGMPAALWAGDSYGPPRRILRWKLDHDIFSYEMECGLIPTGPDDPSAFRTDPDIKSESLKLGNRLVASRKKARAEVGSLHGNRERLELPLASTESMIHALRDGARYPELAAAREVFAAWRFYHHFRTDPGSPARQRRTGTWSPVLAEDGANLASAWQTLLESGSGEILRQAVDEAFPGCAIVVDSEEGQMEICLERPGVHRLLRAAELSDGTLRFLCLCAALLSPQPPPLLVLNEPENSLHDALLAPLGRLVARSATQTQVVVVTHAAALIDAIESETGAKRVALEMWEGQTRRAGHGGGRRSWTFE